MTITSEQRSLCERYGVEPVDVVPGLKVGIATGVRAGAFPLNGLRHPPEAGTNGWYFWSGSDFPQAGAAFEPLHVEHLVARCPELIRFLALPPGWRFLSAPGYEDVWQDTKLLNVGPSSEPR